MVQKYIAYKPDDLDSLIAERVGRCGTTRIFQPPQTSNPRSLKQLYRTITVSVSGSFESSEDFLRRLATKAKSDADLSLRSHLLPQTPTAGNIEEAEWFFRTFPENFYSDRLDNYVAVLTKEEYSVGDLLQTKVLGERAEAIYKQCQVLYDDGCRDADSIMPSIAALAFALGKALHENKVPASAGPSRDAPDFHVFGTRCLYLFLCTDWLSDYLTKSIGRNVPATSLESDRLDLEAARRYAIHWAGLLLRNWVAWRMLTEEMDKIEWFGEGYNLRSGRGEVTENETMQVSL